MNPDQQQPYPNAQPTGYPQPQQPQAQPAPPPQPQPMQPPMYPDSPQQTPQPQQQDIPNVKPKVNPNSTQNALEIAEIRDGIVIMNDGSFRAVIMCKSINFDLMSPSEREAVEYAYQGFLNSLYFPIQILVRSRKVDLKPYIEKMVKIKSEHDNMLLSLLMEDYIYFMDDISQRANIMDKTFYVAIPFFNTALTTENAIKETKGMFSNIFNFNKTPDHVTINESVLEQAKTELKNRVQAVMQGLQPTGVQSLPLDSQELIELYYDSYNPDTSTRQQFTGMENLNVPVITKGEGNAVDHNLDRAMN